MHRPCRLQGSLKRRYKHLFPTSINGYHTSKGSWLNRLQNAPRLLSWMKLGIYTLDFQRKIAHSGLHGETGRISDWVLSLPSERSARSRTSPGRVSERRTLPLWGLGQGCSQRTQRAFGTAMRLCVSLSRRRRGPGGLRDLFAIW